MLLFICTSVRRRWKQDRIQIHLMLLFIGKAGFRFRLWILIQIHLMLLFISSSFIRKNHSIWFKYISCYCLSWTAPLPLCIRLDSNTSHVIVYRGPEVPTVCYAFNSNTSHVIVYPWQYWRPLLWDIFKYISCYCLSVKRRNILPGRAHSNTSHVIVYPFPHVT